MNPKQSQDSVPPPAPSQTTPQQQVPQQQAPQYPYYGQYYNQYPYQYQQQQLRPRKPHSDKPSIAGSLLIIAGVLGLIMASLFVVGGFFIMELDDVDFVSNDFSSIDGTITNESGLPLQGVRVSIDDTHLIATTDANGSYIMQGVPSGFRTIRYELTGYNTIVLNTQIPSSYEDLTPFEQSKKAQDTFDHSMSKGSGSFEYGGTDPFEDRFSDDAKGLFFIGGTVMIICSILAIIGGYCALKRKKYAMAIIGAVAGIFAFGFFLGTVLAIVALFILIIAHKEFNGHKTTNGQPEG